MRSTIIQSVAVGIVVLVSLLVLIAAWTGTVEPTVALATSILAVTFAQLVWRIGEDLIRRRPIIRCSMKVDGMRAEGDPLKAVFDLKSPLTVVVKNIGEGIAQDIRFSGLQGIPPIPGLRPGDSEEVVVPSVLDYDLSLPLSGSFGADCRDLAEKSHSFGFRYEILPMLFPPIATVRPIPVFS